jgi:hypothetical protein
MTGCHPCGRSARSAKAWVIILAAVLAGTAGISAARADEADAKRLLKAMSDYLAAQKVLSFDYDVNLELVSTQQQKIGLASSGNLTLNRPDKLHLTRTGGFANVEMVFDGKTLTLLGKNTNLYTQIWIAQGARPYPCRYVITSKKVTGQPQYTLDIWGWKTGADVTSDSFKLTVPADAKKLTPAEVPELNDIPAHFTAKGGK